MCGKLTIENFLAETKTQKRHHTVGKTIGRVAARRRLLTLLMRLTKGRSIELWCLSIRKHFEK